jgi:hypothetical protein
MGTWGGRQSRDRRQLDRSQPLLATTALSSRTGLTTSSFQRSNLLRTGQVELFARFDDSPERRRISARPVRNDRYPRLFVADKTMDHHVSAILSKLNVSSAICSGCGREPAGIAGFRMQRRSAKR